MQTILDKLRTITLSNAHSLLDAIIDKNSIGAVKQGIRDIESAIEKLQEEAVQAEGSMTTVKENLVGLNGRIEQLNKSINFILGDGNDDNDHLAEPMQVELMGLEDQQKLAQQQYDSFHTTMDALDKVVSGLEAKCNMLIAREKLLEAKDGAADAKERAAKAMELVGNIGGMPSIDDIGAKIEQRDNVADARLKRAMGSVTTGLGQDAALNEAKVRLAERKAAIKAGAAK